MKPALAMIFVAALSLTGCSRSANPLDWKLEGSRPARLQTWLDENLPLMPERLTDELGFCIQNIKVNIVSSASADPAEKNTRLCTRLDGHTVREIMIEGYGLAQDALQAQINGQSESMIRILNQTEVSPEDLKKRQENYQAAVDQLKKQVDKIERRLAELRQSAHPG